MNLMVQLFLSFLQIGLFSIGGGYAAIPLIQSQAVDIHGWLTTSQFMDLATISEMTPGPIAVNSATFVGLKIAGLPGAIVATAGCILPSLIIVSFLAYLYRRYCQISLMQSILGSLRPAVVALIGAAGLNMFLQIAFSGSGIGSIQVQNISWIGIALFAGAMYALRKLKWNPILTMVLCGACNLLLGTVLVL